MPNQEQPPAVIDAETFVIVETRSLEWPSDLQLPSKYFRLFVAADASATPSGKISVFAEQALRAGMVYCCTWGPDCERVHDIVDDILTASEILGNGLFTPITRDDVVMTTWHSDETLDEALEFFRWSSCPTVSYTNESSVWVAVSVANSAWTATIREQLRKLSSSPKEPL